MKIQKFKKSYIDENSKEKVKYLFDGEKDLVFAKQRKSVAITFKGFTKGNHFKIVKNFHYYYCHVDSGIGSKIKAMIYFWKWLNKNIIK